MQTKSIKLHPAIAPAVHINAAHFFEDPQFVQWLNNKQKKFTWHEGGEPNEWSDVVVAVDPSLNGEGSDSDMPEHIWTQIVDACKEVCVAGAATHHILVQLANLEDTESSAERPRSF